MNYCELCKYWRPKQSFKTIKTWAECAIRVNDLIKTECPHQITRLITYYHFGCNCFEKDKLK